MNATAASSPNAPRLMPHPTARRSLRTLFAATVTELFRRERRLALFGFALLALLVPLALAGALDERTLRGANVWLSRVGVIRPPGVGIFRPLGGVPKSVSKHSFEGAILQRFRLVSWLSFSALAAPEDLGMTGRRVRGSRLCGAAGRWWPRRAAG